MMSVLDKASTSRPLALALHIPDLATLLLSVSKID